MADGSSTGVFELLGQPDRLAIVTALIEARQGDDPHLRFTDLRDRAGIDDTGRFNYHLNQLLGTLVMKDGDGYRLSAYGHRVLGPMTGGLYDPDRATETIEADGECHVCGTGLRIRPEGTVLRLVCERGHVNNQGLLGYPAAVGDRSPSAATDALGLINTQAMTLAVSGVCPVCHGPVDGECAPAAEVGLDVDDPDGVYVFAAPCNTCGNRYANTVGSCVLTHPAVVGFLHDHGVDVREVAPWALDFLVHGAERVDSTDPLRLSVAVDRDGDTLTVTVDRGGTAVSTDRSRP
jgi:hypothetical protein